MRGVWVVVALLWVCARAGLAERARDEAERGAGAALDEATRAAAERQLLALLGMERRPPPRRAAPVVPHAMHRLYQQDALPAAAANTVRSYHHSPTALDERFPHHHRFRLYFNMSGVPSDETARGAQVTLQRAPGAGAQRLLVYDVVRPGRRHITQPILRLIDSVPLEAGEDAVTVDAVEAARRWLDEPAHNHGLLVQVTRRDEQGRAAPAPHVRLRRATHETQDEWAALQPLLLLYTEDARARESRLARSKRAARRTHRPHRRKGEAREICQRRPLFVDFADVGWKDWIVAPPGYDAYYCQGDCPFPIADHLNGTNHAIVQTLVNSVNPATVPKACCVPTELSSISMLYMDEKNNVVLKNYQDMMVVGCGCR